MPKENRQPIIFDTFTKVNEDTDPRKLQQGELPLLENAVLDYPFGKIKARGAFINQSGLSSSSSGIRKVINVKDSSDNEHLIGASNSAIYRGTTVISTSVKSGLSGLTKMSHAQMGDELIIVNGADKPFVLTGANFGTNYNLALPTPDSTNIIAQRVTVGSPAGALTSNKQYLYVMVYVTDTGERSEPSVPFGFGALQPSLTQKQFLFKNITPPTDPRITSVWVYRTEGGDVSGARTVNGSLFYLLNKFDPSMTQFVDGVADSELDFSELLIYVNVPTKARYAIQSNNRLFLGGVTIRERFYNTPFIMGKKQGSTSTVGGLTYEDYSIDSRDIVTVLDNQTTGLTKESYYMYAVTFKDANGFESEPVYSNVYDTTGLDNYVHARVDFCINSYIGASNSLDPSAVSRKIYRTTAEGSPPTSASTFYLVNETDYAPLDTVNRFLTAFTDTVDDSTITANEVLAYQYKTALSGIAWSQPDRQAYMKLENIKQVFEEDGDPITGMFDDGNGVLIFKTNSIVKLYHTGAPENWYIRKVWLEHGCDDVNSLLKAGDIYYFSYRKRIYAMPTGGQPQYIGFGKQRTFDLHTIIDVASNDEWFAYATSYSSNYFILVYDRKIQTWYQFNIGTKVLTVLWFQKYSAFFTSGVMYAIVDAKIVKYDRSQSIDVFVTGGDTDISVKVKLPRVNLQGFSPAKFRDFVVDITKTGTVTTVVTSDSTTFSAVNLPAGSGKPVRATGLFGRPASSYFDITLQGVFSFLNGVRIDLRPIRKGLGF